MNLTIELPEEKVAAWKAQAAARGVTIESWLQYVADQQLHAIATAPAERPVWEIILDNMKDVPGEICKQLPDDGASEHDHYLYRHPKRHL